MRLIEQTERAFIWVIYINSNTLRANTVCVLER